MYNVTNILDRVSFLSALYELLADLLHQLLLYIEYNGTISNMRVDGLFLIVEYLNFESSTSHPVLRVCLVPFDYRSQHNDG
jgi:hypothetical protein